MIFISRYFLDAGEFNAGGLIKPLLPGLDCPDHASYFDSLIAEDTGGQNRDRK